MKGRKNAHWELMHPNEVDFWEDAAVLELPEIPFFKGNNPSLHWYRCSPIWNAPVRQTSDDVLILIFAGEMSLTTESGSLDVQAGELIYLPQGTSYRAENREGQVMDQLVIHMTTRLNGELMLSESIEVSGLVPMSENVRQTALECWRHFYGRLSSTEDLCGALVFLWRQVIELYVQAGKLTFREERLESVRRFVPAIQMMTHSLDQCHSVDELARACSLSEPHFRRLFRKAFGMSPVNYRQMLRLNEAARLLEQTDETLERISDRIGYQEVSFFGRAFKAARGVAPGAYRKQVRAELGE